MQQPQQLGPGKRHRSGQLILRRSAGNRARGCTHLPRAVETARCAPGPREKAPAVRLLRLAAGRGARHTSVASRGRGGLQGGHGPAGRALTDSAAKGDACREPRDTGHPRSAASRPVSHRPVWGGMQAERWGGGGSLMASGVENGAASEISNVLHELNDWLNQLFFQFSAPNRLPYIQSQMAYGNPEDNGTGCDSVQVCIGSRSPVVVEGCIRSLKKPRIGKGAVGEDDPDKCPRFVLPQAQLFPNRSRRHASSAMPYSLSLRPSVLRPICNTFAAAVRLPFTESSTRRM